jgi:hypothetical protein
MQGPFHSQASAHETLMDQVPLRIFYIRLLPLSPVPSNPPLPHTHNPFVYLRRYIILEIYIALYINTSLQLGLG